MSDIKFVDGLRVFKPSEKAPGFVKCDLVLNRSELMAWLHDVEGDSVRVSIKERKKGAWYAAVNDFVPEPRDEKRQPQSFEKGGFQDDTPF